MAKTIPAALGLRVHSGWAALIVVGGSARAPEISARRRIEMADPQLLGSQQPYHAAEGLELAKAGALLKRFRETAERMAVRGLGDVIAEARERGQRMVGCGILESSGRVGSSLATTLASHALIHTADGNHFRDALKGAAEHHDLPVVEVRERELMELASRRLGLSPKEVGRELVELGRPLGPPWTQDQKYAALVARLVLAGGRP
ncbi:MAG TPA: hypothetical protein VKI41_18075 [Vicinamibacteria bacterium]|nr:hypothetical protein [Vicinamibacteria bacterium]